LGLAPDKVVVLLVAHRLEQTWKGMSHAVAALNQVGDPRLLVAVVGRFAEPLTGELRRPSIAVPYQAERHTLAGWYRAADMLIMPSLEEVFGMVAAEAMACGTPVVAYATGGLPEVLGDEGGIVVPRGDVPALAGAIADLVRDEARRRELGARAACRAAEHFGLGVVARRYESLYEELLRPPGLGAR
jgi:glycosyltransferase involved in cell wall biosynthesis